MVKLSAALSTWIIEHECNKIWFDKILEQCLAFDPYDRTKSDCVVSAMIAVVSALEVTRPHSSPKDPLIKIYGNKQPNYKYAVFDPRF